MVAGHVLVRIFVQIHHFEVHERRIRRRSVVRPDGLDDLAVFALPGR
jgi:hypothetical protein